VFTNGMNTFFNPKPIQATVIVDKTKVSKEIKGVPVFDPTAIDQYAEQLANSGKEIVLLHPDLVLVPLRGGLRPFDHLRIYCNISEKAVWFPFTGEQSLSCETFAILFGALQQFFGPGSANIVVIDTAERGYGAIRLARIVRNIHHNNAKSHWRVTFNLFVPQQQQWAEWQYQVKKLSTERLTFDVKLYGVLEVLGEDVDEAVSLPENFKTLNRAVFGPEGNQFLVETFELPRLLDEEIAKATYDLHFTDPVCRVIDIHEYTQSKMENSPLTHETKKDMSA
jgi:hypothetical protein